MRGLFGSSGKSAPKRASSLRPMTVEMAPERPFYAIGDVHGCYSQMREALVKVDEDIERNSIDDPALVFLGDYIDRGEQSAAVLQDIFQLGRDQPDSVVCIMGNHERMMLDFIDDPVGKGQRWLRFGGLQTLASFGVGGVTERSTQEQMYEAAEELVEKMPDGMEAWLRALPVHWHSGNMHCVHAAMEPDVPVMQQSRRVLLWGCDTFEKFTRTDGNWVIHGHTVVDQPKWDYGRVSLDTGCYFSGLLTTAAFTNNTCRIL